MIEPLLLIGLVVAIFVGYNIGGATTGPAFGPAVGADVITKTAAAAFMSVFFFVGAFTIGREVVDTLSEGLIDPGVFTLQTSITVLFFIGFALFIGNFFGVPASTSMTTVGAIAALGSASGTLNWAELGTIVTWWLVAPLIGFWVCGVIGRYFYPRINAWINIQRSDNELFIIDTSRRIPRVTISEESTRRELFGAGIVIAIGCLMAFSSGTSNIANAIAPLVGSGDLEMNTGIIIGSVAVGIGAFTIGRRTMETLGNDITHLPLTAAIVIATVSSFIVVALSALGIPASFVVIATMGIVGLGWGRATRTVGVREGVRGEKEATVSVGALSADKEGEELPDIGEEEPEDIPSAGDLFDPGTTGRVILLQNLVPAISTIGAYLVFRFVPVFPF
ncbi:inorganic phosphate transporter [Natranaeroarchaeum aerophilus]|uniref:Phosphate transporter n=1 Tax=Natranaeroarchaeum aerophilus TaxID=2917711 RepID=A0AAE3K362_9EURY|nr:inorganic phosphate transporter family protein [Natranaeroarchaeum aerophilus]